MSGDGEGAGMADTQDRDVVELRIERLGAQGDGVATAGPDGGPVFVPFTLPGERVRACVAGERGRLIEVVSAAPERIEPACGHFGTCGGCMLQHMSVEAYASWKRSLVSDAFAQRGIAVDVADVVMAGAGARRRAVLSAIWTRGGAALGFHRLRDDSVIDIAECPVLEPRIVAALDDVRGLLGVFGAWEGEARVTTIAADNGLDVDLSGAVGKTGLDAARSARLAGLAGDVGNLVRLSVDGAPVYQRARPELGMGAARVDPPAGVFLQASGKAEREMAALVVAAVAKKAKSAVDLFSGVGAFTFPLAARVTVTAVDSDRRALSALDAAARGAQGIKPIRTLHRDLFREPLSRKELEPFDVAVFDPPRAGAAAQAQMLAKSKVPVIVAVSCNPATLARDVRTLIDGGYSLGTVTPIDQFHWSAHVEAVAVLRR